MRSLVFALLVAAATPLLLVACGDKTVVTDRHIRMATEKCEVNGGVQQFDQAGTTALTESCGYKCSRRTGVYAYSASFSCKNGAKFDLTWQE